MTPEQEREIHQQARKFTLLFCAIGGIIILGFVLLWFAVRMNRTKIDSLQEPTELWRASIMERLQFFETEIKRLEGALVAKDLQALPTPTTAD